VIGTAGWIRTTDLLIHSQHQVIDFPMVGSKSNFAPWKIKPKLVRPRHLTCRDARHKGPQVDAALDGRLKRPGSAAAPRRSRTTGSSAAPARDVAGKSRTVAASGGRVAGARGSSRT